MQNNSGYVIAIVILVLALIYVWFIGRGDKSATGANQEGDMKCELRGSDGHTITITGRGSEFEKLCKSQDQPVNLYGYQYYPIYYYRWYRPWGWRRWSWGGHRSV